MVKNNSSRAFLAKLFLGVIALVCFFAFSASELRDGHGGVTTGQVLTATSSIEPNEQLREKTRVEDWPIDKIPDGAVRRIDDVNGFVATDRIYKGELILMTKLMAPKP